MKINQQFVKNAQLNATHTGLTKQVKKNEGEVKSEQVHNQNQDKVSVGDYQQNATHIGMGQTMGKKTTGAEEKKMVDAQGRPVDKETGRIIDPNTGQPAQMPGQQTMIDPRTGQPGNISDIAGSIHPSLQELVNSGHLSKEDLTNILALDTQRREEEMMVKQHEQSEKEAMKDCWLNMWLQAQQAEKERMKTFMAYMDAIRTIDAQIAANRAATNKAINDTMNAALFG